MKIKLIVIGLFFVAVLFGQSDTTKREKAPEKESKTEKYDKIEKKLWEQNRQMDKLNKNDTIK